LQVLRFKKSGDGSSAGGFGPYWVDSHKGKCCMRFVWKSCVAVLGRRSAPPLRSLVASLIVFDRLVFLFVRRWLSFHRSMTRSFLFGFLSQARAAVLLSCSFLGSLSPCWRGAVYASLFGTVRVLLLVVLGICPFVAHFSLFVSVL